MSEFVDYPNTVEGHLERVQTARDQGFTIIEAADNSTLLLDLDSPAAIDQYARNKDLAAVIGGLAESDWWYSKSGIGKHVVLKSDFIFTDLERLLLQAALGSDGKREMFSLNLWQKTGTLYSVLFKPANASKIQENVIDLGEELPF